MDKLIQYFFENTEKEYHVRELAKLMNKSPTTVSKHLGLLKQQGILTSKKKFNHLFYMAADNLKFKDLKFSYNLKKIRDSGLMEYLVKNYNHPEVISLFGSFRKAENFSESDIDLVVISPLKKELDFSKFEKKLGHKIQVFQHTKKSIEEMKTKNKELLNNFLNGYVMYGYWEIFK